MKITNDKTKTIAIYKSHEINCFFYPIYSCDGSFLDILLVLTPISQTHRLIDALKFC